jgi:hypothetical protein
VPSPEWPLVLPDFVVIGGSKSGTHWVNECLREHPEVYVTPDTHEIFFFDCHFDRGVDWYAHYFRGRRDEQRVGDVTPTYLAHPLAAERLHRVLPEATLIVSLRNSVARAWSKYLHLWRKGDIPSRLDFWEACARRPEILGDGEYHRCLVPWRRLFPPEQLHLLVLDDAAADPFGFMSRVYDIIGVDPRFRAVTTTRRTNEHQTPRSMVAARLAFRTSRFLHDSGMHWVVEQGKRWYVKDLVLRPGPDQEKDPPRLAGGDRERLLDHFQEDVAALSELVGRDLVALWLGREAKQDQDADRSRSGNAVRRAAS